ncbi:dihydroxyacetone kinase subunit DhaL [Cryobacterium sp. Y57]|uniref:dihydroxyacetone kinase subunit DhaL n=1 Tax=Cryobacterium sp. Y57 TaxID=2048287 RepID=UPI000CE4C7B4|nr:dihydroxyacetone kinase subunit DhaL [Cryobacterium sp. Y57]
MKTRSIIDTEFVVRSIAETAIENEEAFCELDSVVGDGDFGYSLARGFEKVLEEWDVFDRTDSSIFLKSIAHTITSRIGGTSGPLWGTAFLRASTAVRGRDAVGGADVVAMLRAAIAGIKDRGKSDVGDKTLLDALVPATDALEVAVAQGSSFEKALDEAAKAARVAADATSSLQARRGRASYTGERSIGSPDAGAVAVAIILERLTVEARAR